MLIHMYQRGLSESQRDRVLLRRERTLRQALGARVVRRSDDVSRRLKSEYAPTVTTGSVDKTRWVAVVQRLMDKHAKGKKATFAKLVGVDPRTVTDWLAGTYAVREAMVRQVADRTGEVALDLLVEVGVFSANDIPAAGVAAEDQWIVEVIQASTKLDQATKTKLIAVELAKARREREEKRRHLDEQIDIFAGSSDDDE